MPAVVLTARQTWSVLCYGCRQQLSHGRFAGVDRNTQVGLHDQCQTSASETHHVDHGILQECPDIGLMPEPDTPRSA